MTTPTDDRAEGSAVLNELRGWGEPARLMRHSLSLPRRARLSNHVMVLPGLAADDASTIPLRWYLRRLGHSVQGWELGRHQPYVSTSMRRFGARLDAAVDEAGETFVLVGWSLGGVVARETARSRPELVTQVITLGSPIGGPADTSTGMQDGTASAGHDRSAAFGQRRPIRVPTTSIYSRRDGVVKWRGSIDHHTPGVRNIEVTSSHFGLGVDPDVWRIIATSIDEHSPRPVSAATNTSRRVERDGSGLAGS